MALNIVPGPLPDDGTRIRVEQTLSDFVRGTLITNFGPDSFDVNEVNLVLAQTEAPANPGHSTLWFQRGQGALYKWQPHPSPTNPYFDKADAPSVGASEGSWVRMSDGREQLVHTNYGAKEGEVLRVTTATTEFKALAAGDNQFLLSMDASVPTDLAVTNFTQSYIVDPVMVPTENMGSNTIGVVTDFGFAPMRVVGSGAGQPLFVGDFGAQLQGAATHVSAVTETNCFCAFLCESTASVSPRLATRVFIKPTLSNNVHQEAT